VDACEYLSYVTRGEPCKCVPEYLVGRVLRGVCESDFCMLAENRMRKLVFLLDAESLATFPGKMLYEILDSIGYGAERIARSVAAGMQFRLAVFPRNGIAKLATWDNVLNLVCEAYPRIAHVVEQHREMLKTTPVADIERALGFRIAELGEHNSGDARRMTYEKLISGRGTLEELRLFLFCAESLNEHFKGDGYTVDSRGVRQHREYIAPNVELAVIGGLAMSELRVELPNA
jgi:hypothetical protein